MALSSPDSSPPSGRIRVKTGPRELTTVEAKWTVPHPGERQDRQEPSVTILLHSGRGKRITLNSELLKEAELPVIEQALLEHRVIADTALQRAENAYDDDQVRLSLLGGEMQLREEEAGAIAESTFPRLGAALLAIETWIRERLDDVWHLCAYGRTATGQRLHMMDITQLRKENFESLRDAFRQMSDAYKDASAEMPDSTERLQNMARMADDVEYTYQLLIRLLTNQLLIRRKIHKLLGGPEAEEPGA